MVGHTVAYGETECYGRTHGGPIGRQNVMVDLSCSPHSNQKRSRETGGGYSPNSLASKSRVDQTFAPAFLAKLYHL